MPQQVDGFAAIQHTLEDGSLFLVGQLPRDLVWNSPTFDEIWSLHSSDKHRITIYGREVETPRWQQAFGEDYYYTGRVNEALPVPDVLKPQLAWAQRTIDPQLNGILCNWYEGPTHYIGPHHDSLNKLVDGTPIVTLSFGETRMFRLSRGKGSTRKTYDYPAPSGTVFVMPYATNLSWKHEVKKSARYYGRRISITIRAFRDGEADLLRALS